MIYFIILILVPFLMWILFVLAQVIGKHATHLSKSICFLVNAYIIFVNIYNVIFNFTYATILFLELPRFRRRTFSERLIHILSYDNGWRFKFAYWIAYHLIEPWDYNHCNLQTDRLIAKAVYHKLRKY